MVGGVGGASIVGAVSPRFRVSILVALAAAAAAGVTVGATLLSSSGEEAAAPRRAGGGLRPGAPPLVLDLGVRTDAEAADLRRAAALFDRGRRLQAGRVFARHPSLEAKVGAALAAWPSGRGRLRVLALEHPRSALVQLHLGLALFWEGRLAAARAAWRRARQLEPDTAYAVRAADLLHPDMAPGLPPFVPSFRPPPQLERLAPPDQLAFLRAVARRGGVREKLLYGVALQRLDQPLSAAREFEAAAALAPRDPEARVAAAVGRFDKDAPERAFGRLGLLVRTFPGVPTVHFHLGLLLLWLGRVGDAKRELRLARAEGPRTPLGREAERFLARLEAVRTKRPKR